MGQSTSQPDHNSSATQAYQKLAEETARLRAEIEQWNRAKVADQTPDNSPAERDEVFRFLDLPKDIRLITYEFAVVPGVITLRVNPSTQRGRERLENDERYAGLDGPVYGETQLFAVCKQIRDESLGLYLHKNLFIWPNLDIGTYELFNTDDDQAMIYGPHARKLLRNLSITFTYRDSIDPRTVARRWIEFTTGRAPVPPQVQHLVPLGPRGQHAASRGEMVDFWHDLIGPIATDTSLKRLIVHVENAYCDGGCCRMLDWVRDELFLGHKWDVQPKEIEFVGATREEAQAPIDVRYDWLDSATRIKFRAEPVRVEEVEEGDEGEDGEVGEDGEEHEDREEGEVGEDD